MRMDRIKATLVKHTLQTNRLRLLPCEIQDLDLLFRFLRNDHIKRFLCDNRDLKKEFVHSIIRKSDALFESKAVGLWLVQKLEDLQIVGFCGISRNEMGKLEILYGLHPDFLHQGYATESANTVIHYFRSHFPEEALMAKVDEPNTASLRVIARLGMQRIGREWNPVLRCDMILYQLNGAAG